MNFDARDLARGWLAVALASAKDAQRPVLSRTVFIEQYPGEGVRLVATDSYVLLHAWVPDLEHANDPGPGLDEAPDRTAIAIDTHGRAKGFLHHLLRLAIKAEKEDWPAVEVRLRLDVADPDRTAQATLAGLEARYVVIEQPDTGDEAERLKLLTCEGVYPPWRKLLGNFAPELTTQLALAPDLVGQLAKVGKIHPGSRLGWSFGGENKAARVTVIDSDPHVEGIAMPCRWDIDTNAPRVDDVVDEAERIAREAAELDDEGDADG